MPHKPLHPQLLGKKDRPLQTKERDRKGPRKLQERDLSKMFRSAFQKTLDDCNQILSVLGNIEAFDYASLKENEGAKYAPPKGFPLLEFTVDVLKLAKDTLTPGELRFFEAACYNNPDIDYTIQDEDFLRLQEKLGRVFVGQGLFPSRKYFITIKK